MRHRWLVIGVMLVGASALATRIPLLEIETLSDDYLLESDPEKIAYDAFRDQYGRDQLIFVVVEPREVFSFEFLDWLEVLHDDLERNLPHLDEVTSLVNVRSIYSRPHPESGTELVVDDLLERRPKDAAGLAALRERVLATPSYIDSMISADGRVTALQVKSFAYSESDVSRDAETDADRMSGFGDVPDAGPRRFLTARENTEFSRALLEVVDRHRRDDIVIHVTGQPLVAYALTRSMAQDLPRIFGFALALVGILVVLLFRRLSPLLLSATVVLLSLVSTLGLSQLAGFAIGLPSQILPSFMLALSVGYVVHLLTIYFRALPERRGDRAGALEDALRHVGLPILMTALTTIAGLVSFVSANLDQAYQLGMMGAIGVAMTFLFAVGFVPAVLGVLPARDGRALSGLEGGSRLLAACARISIRHPKKLVAAAGLLAIGSLALLPQLDYSADPMAYFPEDHWLRTGTYFTDERMGGMQSLEVVVDTKRENGLHEVDVLDRLESMDALVATLRDEGERVTRTWSMLQVLKETHQALNDGRPEYYAIPRDRDLIAQELLLFENSGADDLESFVDTEFSQARVSILTAWEDGVEKQRFIERVADRIEATMGDQAEVWLTGGVKMISRAASASSETFLRSYSLALGLITPLMILLIGSLRAGLVSMVPNLIPIFSALALMVVVGVELDMFTILGACIAIGLAVDDSIHFITGFRRQLVLTGDPERAIEITMESTGRALLFTSVVLVAGFSVLGFSSMANLGYLGLTTAFAIGMAFLLDVTVTPALLLLTHRKVGTAVQPDGSSASGESAGTREHDAGPAGRSPVAGASAIDRCARSGRLGS